MFVSLVKMLKGKLEFLKKAINNSRLVETATVPLLCLRSQCSVSVWMCVEDSSATWDITVVLVWVLRFRNRNHTPGSSFSLKLEAKNVPVTIGKSKLRKPYTFYHIRTPPKN